MRKNPKRPYAIAASLLVGVSFVVCTVVVITDVGIWNTPYETTHSAGRRMGFNDPLSAEHWGTIFSNFRIQKLLIPAYAYSWLLLAMHGLAAWMLLRVDSLGRPLLRWFFALQGLLFPVGWLGFLALPLMIEWVLNGTFDREAIIDAPFVVLTAQPIWIATAMTIFALSWRASRRTPNERGECTIA